MYSKRERLCRHRVPVVQGFENFLDGDVQEQTQGTEEHTSENTGHDGDMWDVAPPRVQDKVARGPQVKDDEVRPTGKNGRGIQEHSAQTLRGAEHRRIDGEQSLREEHVSEHDVQNGISNGDGERDGLGVTPSRKKHQRYPCRETAEIHRVEYLVVCEGQKREWTGSCNRSTRLRLGGGKGHA